MSYQNKPLDHTLVRLNRYLNLLQILVKSNVNLLWQVRQQRSIILLSVQKVRGASCLIVTKSKNA